MSIKIYPETCLRQKTAPVKKFDSELKDTICSMTDVMYASGGIGLAATQVGLSSSILVIDIGDGLQCFINPEITEYSSGKTEMEEGCLSLPGLTVMVSRPEKLKVKATTPDGNTFEKSFDGLMAKALQHEMDHLRGVLIIDYLDPFRRYFASRRIRKAKSGKIL